EFGQGGGTAPDKDQIAFAKTAPAKAPPADGPDVEEANVSPRQGGGVLANQRGALWHDALEYALPARRGRDLRRVAIRRRMRRGQRQIDDAHQHERQANQSDFEKAKWFDS